eukprot:scaffold42343_cov75-Phaeocystis_antarctica.AAC.1
MRRLRRLLLVSAIDQSEQVGQVAELHELEVHAAVLVLLEQPVEPRQHDRGHLLDLGGKRCLHGGLEARAGGILLERLLGVAHALLHRVLVAHCLVGQRSALVGVVPLAHRLVRLDYILLGRALVELEQRVRHADGHLRLSAKVLDTQLGDAREGGVRLVVAMRRIRELNVQRPGAHEHTSHAPQPLDRLCCHAQPARALEQLEQRLHLRHHPRVDRLVHTLGLALDLGRVDASQPLLEGVQPAHCELEAQRVALREGTLDALAHAAELADDRAPDGRPRAVRALVEVRRERGNDVPNHGDFLPCELKVVRLQHRRARRVDQFFELSTEALLCHSVRLGAPKAQERVARALQLVELRADTRVDVLDRKVDRLHALGRLAAAQLGRDISEDCAAVCYELFALRLRLHLLELAAQCMRELARRRLICRHQLCCRGGLAAADARGNLELAQHLTQ